MIDGDFTPPTSPGYNQPTKLLDGSSGLTGMFRVYPNTITDAQVAQARLHRWDIDSFIIIFDVDILIL